MGISKKLKTFKTSQNKVTEISFNSKKDYKDPFNEIELDIVFSGPKGEKLKIPAFWAGKNIWKVRFSSPHIGEYEFKPICSDRGNKSLNDIEGKIIVSRYKGKNKLYRHGPLKVSKNNKYMEHLDGTAFLWLADTWWHGFTDRVKWPDEYKMLVRDRAKKSFNVIQIVAGFYWDDKNQNSFGKNEGGWPWDLDDKIINPAFFDSADLRINSFVENGIVPCVFGAWGWHLHFQGIKLMKKHWRYIIARWGAYPVVWSVAGETRHSYVRDEPNRQENIKINKKLQKGWNEVARYIKKIDPYRRLMTTHPSPGDGTWSSRDVLEDSLIDIDMLQTGHFDVSSFEDTFRTLHQALRVRPRKPVFNGEVCYEGICGSSWDNTQRFIFWTHILSGAAGHTYGTTGVESFVVEKIKDLYPKRTDSYSILEWGDYTWREGYKFLGSLHLGIAKKLLEQFEWYKFEPHQEWVEPHSNKKNWQRPYAAGIPKEVRVIYIPPIYLNDPADLFNFRSLNITNLEKDIKYRAYFFNPRTGDKLPDMEVIPDSDGVWEISGGKVVGHPNMEDWVLVLENIKLIMKES